MDPNAGLLAIATLSLLAAISPGPDFFVVLKNSIVSSRREGFYTALGVSIALIVHLTYTLAGIGIVIAESPSVYTAIKYTGAAYLLYIGAKGFIGSFKKEDTTEESYIKGAQQLTPTTAFMQGFLTNLLNPKCALFFVSLFSQFIDPTTPATVRMAYAAVNWSVTLGWFLFLAYLVTGSLLKSRLTTFRRGIDRVMGLALVLLAVKLLLAP